MHSTYQRPILQRQNNKYTNIKRNQEKDKNDLPIISSFIFSRFTAARGSSRRMDFPAWPFEGSISKIFFISANCILKRKKKLVKRKDMGLWTKKKI